MMLIACLSESIWLRTRGMWANRILNPENLLEEDDRGLSAVKNFGPAYPMVSVDSGASPHPSPPSLPLPYQP